MLSTVFAAIVALTLYSSISYAYRLWANTARAKAIGLTYIVCPITPHSNTWLVFNRSLTPWVKRLPKSWWETWLPYASPNWTWELLYEDAFPQIGDAFILVTPDRLRLCLANAEAIREITFRRDAFPKALEAYKSLDMFGRNVLGTEGAEWREHRKATAPTFNEKNNVLAFAEAAKQAQSMIKKWLSVSNTTINDVPKDTMRTTLHIIARVGFGVRLLWPGETPSDDQSMRAIELRCNEVPEGHTLSFESALSDLLEYLVFVVLIPMWLLKMLPFKATKIARKAYVNWQQYMKEMFAQKLAEAREGKTSEGMDIMGSLIRSTYGTSVATSPAYVAKEKQNQGILTDAEILGNTFVMILAGHETTSNTTHFSLIELALNPKSQRALQQEVVDVFGDTAPENWDYDSSLNKLLTGMCGAVLNEQLRLMPSVAQLPKQVSLSSDQALTIDGKKYILPAGSHIAMSAPGVHRNPRYWPTQPSNTPGAKNDLNDFRPERWLQTPKSEKFLDAEDAVDGEHEQTSAESATASLFRPTRGSYVPFSDGPRQCMGKRLAQVQMMAIYASIFQNCSIELAVDQWATDEEVTAMSQDEKRVLYAKAQKNARAILRGATITTTLKLHPPGPTSIPLRVVRKGSERFVNFI